MATLETVYMIAFLATVSLFGKYYAEPPIGPTPVPPDIEACNRTADLCISTCKCSNRYGKVETICGHSCYQHKIGGLCHNEYRPCINRLNCDCGICVGCKNNTNCSKPGICNNNNKLRNPIFKSPVGRRNFYEEKRIPRNDSHCAC